MPLLDLAWNLRHLNIGLVDFMGVSGFARGWAENHAWPATPYFPAGYPLLLAPFGYLGEAMHRGGVLQGGYILSAFGAVLLLAAVWRLGRHWGLPDWWALCAVLLGWLSPEIRVSAGAPSPDMLASGAGACFFALACEAWDQGKTGGRGTLALALAGAASVFLRYHMLVLALPIALFLAFRRHSRAAGLAALGGLAAAMLINHGVYWLQFHTPLLGSALIQVRTGLSFRYARPYISPRELFSRYPEFVAHCRSTPLFADYGPAEVGRHLALDWLQYLRRPAIVLAAFAALGAILLRRRLPGSQWLALAWLPLFTLALSPAYYVPRAAALPVSIAVTLTMASARLLLPERQRAIQLLAAALLLCGFGLASRFALADFRLRLASAKACRALADVVQREGLDWETMAQFSGYIYRVEGNPWFKRGYCLHTTWLDDPAIRPEQLPDRQRVDVLATASREDRTVESVVTFEPGFDTDQWRSLANSHWRVLANAAGAEVWVPLDP